ncbi:MAG TPA: hypothetical protein VKX16_12860 [Chloroflexota bacterium]|nr:hypothetical protein [Chloroflexota bacterium]
MRRKCRWAIVPIVAGALLLSGGAAVAAGPSSFTILTSGPLALSFGPNRQSDTAELSILVQPAGGKPLSLRFVPVLHDSRHADASGRVVVRPSTLTVAPANTPHFPIAELALTISLAPAARPILGPGDALNGYLLVEGGRGRAAVQTVALQITSDASTATAQGDLIVGGIGDLFRLFGIYSWATALIAAAALIGAIFFVCAAAAAGWWKNIDLSQAMTKEFQWDTSKSWLSVLTGSGALLGTILAAGIFPAQPAVLSKQVYGGLNIFFGLALLVPPLMYSLFHTRGQHGYRWIFLLAGSITVAAVAGELLTILVLIPELVGNAALSLAATNTFRLILLVLCVLAPVYGLTSVLGTLEADNRAGDPQAARAAYQQARDQFLQAHQAAEDNPNDDDRQRVANQAMRTFVQRDAEYGEASATTFSAL